VEFIEHETDLDDLICDVADMELPDVPGEDRPAYPLDPGPLIQGTSRMIGSVLGLGLLATRRLVGTETPLPAAGVAEQTFTIIGILQSIPPIHFGLRKLFGRTVADLLLNIPAIITLTLSEYPLGLAVTGSESLLLTTEVYARRRAWKRHEERIASAPSAQPDAVIHLEAGERTPLPGKVLEGAGTALGRDGMPLPAVPGSIVPPGARLFGGPFVLKLESEEAFQPFTPQPRPVSVAPSLFERYTQVIGPITLAYTAATAIFIRSFTRTLAALLLVSPRIAVIGVDSADLGASARVLRAGVTVVGTRPHRMIRLPDCVFLDGARLLTDELELLSALPLHTECDSAELLARAAGIEAAAGSPWGGVFRATATISATNGSFDGKTASAYAEGIQYTLGPSKIGPRLQRRPACARAVTTCLSCAASMNSDRSVCCAAPAACTRHCRAGPDMSTLWRRAWSAGRLVIKSLYRPWRSELALRFLIPMTPWELFVPGRERVRTWRLSRIRRGQPRPSMPATSLSASAMIVPDSLPAPTCWLPTS